VERTQGHSTVGPALLVPKMIIDDDWGGDDDDGDDIDDDDDDDDCRFNVTYNQWRSPSH